MFLLHLLIKSRMLPKVAVIGNTSEMQTAGTVLQCVRHCGKVKTGEVK